ncbi:MAG: DUF3010 family protein [Vibrionaceae bacterium]
MRICAVELTGNELNLCLLELQQGLFNVPDCRARKMTLVDATDPEQLLQFQKQFAKLLEDYRVEKVVIRGRPMQGKFSGSAASFKMEAALQLLDCVSTQILTSSEIKAALKRSPQLVSAKELGLKQFQQSALETGVAYFNHQ